MDTKGKRLRWAREEAGFKSARSVALDLEMKVPTYNSHERAGDGGRDFGEEDARRYGRKFRVQAAWLLTGEGRAKRTSAVRIVGLVGLGDQIQWSEEGDMSLGEIELPYDLPEGCFGLEARGSSQYPRVQDGEVVIARWLDGDPAQFVGRELVIKTSDSVYLLKTLKRHQGDSHFTIGSHNAPDVEDVHVVRAGEVMSIVPAKQWKRIA